MENRLQYMAVTVTSLFTTSIPAICALRDPANYDRHIKKQNSNSCASNYARAFGAVRYQMNFPCSAVGCEYLSIIFGGLHCHYSNLVWGERKVSRNLGVADARTNSVYVFDDDDAHPDLHFSLDPSLTLTG